MAKYINVSYKGENNIKIEFGVRAALNMFAPDDKIPYFADITGCEGKKATVSFLSGKTLVDVKTHTLKGQSQVKGSFSASRNGIYVLRLSIAGLPELNFRVGVVPKSKRASKEFYFGVQSYLCNTYFSPAYRVKYQNREQSWASILNTIDWLGANLTREDGVSWARLQEKADAPFQFKPMDGFVKMTAKRDIDLLWIIGGSPEWAVMKKYRDTGKPSWALPAEPDLQDARIKAIAKHYKKNKNLLYEIWNEADWEFFLGTEEEYIDLLNRAVDIIRKTDPDKFILPSALVSSWELETRQTFAKNSVTYYTAYKDLLEKGKIDALNVHDHAHFLPEKMTWEKRTSYLHRAGFNDGIPNGGFNTESGIWADDENEQAWMLMNKTLWYRSHGFKAFVSYDFRDYHDTGTKWPIFTSTLQPKPAAIAYTVLIGTIGNSSYVGSLGHKEYRAFADVFGGEDGGRVALYSFNGEKARLKIKTTAPFELTDMYGNPTVCEADGTVEISHNVKYLKFSEQISLNDFEILLS